jgi:hypothetical protein
MCVCVALGFVVEKKRTKKGGKDKTFFSRFFSPLFFLVDGNPPTPPPLSSPSPYQRDFFLFFLQCHSHTLVSFSSLNPLAMSLVGTASREFEVTHVGKKFLGWKI